jgi:tRNA G10  N-methylase Trm11
MQEHVATGSVDLIFTDPPYGIAGDQLDNHYNRDDSKVIPGYVDVPVAQYAEWCRTWIQECERVLRPGGSMYIVSGYSNLHHILNALHATGLQEINHVIAQYSFGVYTKRKWVSSHYHVLFWSKKETTPTTIAYQCNACRENTSTARYATTINSQKSLSPNSSNTVPILVIWCWTRLVVHLALVEQPWH